MALNEDHTRLRLTQYCGQSLEKMIKIAVYAIKIKKVMRKLTKQLDTAIYLNQEATCISIKIWHLRKRIQSTSVVIALYTCSFKLVDNTINRSDKSSTEFLASKECLLDSVHVQRNDFLVNFFI